ncbi:MAG: prepilin peptidase CpaA [Sphingomonadales bacterium]|jgi:prepilin peptidase CpaA|nr:prepilin peptidase CpaA [Sphingomonadales bacterium]
MQWGISELFVLVLAAALVAAAVGDLRTRTIPNWLNLAVALAAIPFWYVSDLGLWPEIALRIGIAAAVFGLFAAAFALGMMGGGDVKLLAALALWLPPPAVAMLLVVMSLAGGALTLLLAVRHRMARREEKLEIPYGVAIAFGGLWLIGERFLNQFG